MPWIKDVLAGEKIPPTDYDNIRSSLGRYLAAQPWGTGLKLQLRFKGRFCYVAQEETDGSLSPLCRLCYLGRSRWSSAFFTYSNERYEPCILPTGSSSGTLEEAFSVCRMYLV